MSNYFCPDCQQHRNKREHGYSDRGLCESCDFERDERLAEFIASQSEGVRVDNESRRYEREQGLTHQSLQRVIS